MIKIECPSIKELTLQYPDEALKIFSDSGIIDKEAALVSWYFDMRNKKVDKIHQYKIWQSSSDRKWRTYIEKSDGNRKLIALKDKESLYQVLAEHYGIQESSKKYTLESLFPEWLKYKALHTRTTKAVRHHSSDWKAYYEGSPIVSIPIKSLTKLILDEWIHSLIKSRKLTVKQYGAVSCIVRQVLDYAVDKDIIKTNPFRTVKIQRGLLVIPMKKNAKTQVYDSDELNSLLQEAYKDFESSGDTSSLAIVLCSKTGIRIGECMGLKFSDLYEGYIHIRREEIVETPLLPNGSYGAAEYVIVDHCKTDAGLRDIPAVSEAIDIFNMVNNVNMARNCFADYLFIKKDGTKMHARSVDSKIRTLCSRAGIAPRSVHKLRKTFISTLIDANMNIDTVRRIAGHKDESVTLSNYCYDRSKPEVIRNQLEKALG